MSVLCQCCYMHPYKYVACVIFIYDRKCTNDTHIRKKSIKNLTKKFPV